jgi:hypothetical protein
VARGRRLTRIGQSRRSSILSDLPRVLTLCLCLCVPLVAASPATAKGVRVYGPKVISRDTPLPDSCDGQRQETDTMIAVDPRQSRRLVATWDQDEHRSNVLATSRNGGRSWRLSILPGISKCTGGASDEVVDPWVSIGRKGAAYFTSLPLSVSGFLVNRSRDAGASFSAPAMADPAAGLTDDLPSVVADPRRSRRAYFTWSRLVFSGGEMVGGDARFSGSNDGARTFSAPVVIHTSPAGKLVLESRLARLPAGRLLDVFGEASAKPLTAPQEAFATRSADGGRTWSDPVRITTVPQDPILDPDTGRPQYGFCCLFGTATGRRTRAYIAYTRVAGAHSARVVLVRSTNGGRRWGRARTVARVPAQAFQAAVAVAGDGTVGVTWYDFRRDKPGDAALTTDVWFAYSQHEGRKWRRRHLAGPFDLRSASRIGRPVGVYHGLAGLPHGFVATFIQAAPWARYGTEDVFFARVRTPRRRR